MGNSTLPLGGGDPRRIKETILQVSHGFSVGEVVRHNGTIFVLALADSAANAEAVGIIEAATVNDFDVVYQGRIDISTLGYGTDEVLFLSDVTPGLLISTPPGSAGSVIKAMLLTADAVDGIVTGYVGVQIGGDNVVSLNDIQPVGCILPWAADASSPVPIGWALCNGDPISRTTYSDLFNLIGTLYGVGDGATTFNVPDLQRRVPVGQDPSGAAPFDIIAVPGGAETHTLSLSELPSSADHNHQLDSETTAELNLGTGSDVPLVQDGAGSTTAPEGSIEPGGGDAAFSILQPFLTVNFIIRTIEQARAGLLDHGLDDHFDVDTVTIPPTDGDVLTWTGTIWEPSRNTFAFRNLLINGNFDIWQRGTSWVNPSTGTFTADRWVTGHVDDGGAFTGNITQGVFVPGQSDLAPADDRVPDNPTYYLDVDGAVAGAATNNEQVALIQRIENVMNLSGQAGTLSFYAKGSIAGDVHVNVRQFLDPTSQYNNDAVITLTTKWQKFSVTLTMPTVSGALGANNSLRIRFFLQVGTAASASIGVAPFQYNGTLSLASVQFESGLIDTVFEQRQIESEIALCQRYYCKSWDINTPPSALLAAPPGVYDAAEVGAPGTHRTDAQTNTRENAYTESWPVRMRVAPTVLVVQNLSPVQNLSAYDVGEGSVTWSSTNSLVTFLWTADAEL